MRNLCPHRFANAPVRKFIFALSLALLAVLMLPGSLKAQSNISGDLVGTVTDPSGAAVPNAKVTVTNAANGQVKVTASGSAGEFRVPLLSPGAYKVSVTAPGFETTDLDASVSAGTVSPLNVKLTVGASSTTVQVTGTDIQVLHTDDAQISTTFSLSQIQNMPNPGNDLTFVAQTAPGAVMNTQGGYGNFSVFGLPATSNTFTVNGGYEGDPYLNLNNSGATNLLLGNNDVDNVTVTTNAYDAAFGGLGRCTGQRDFTRRRQSLPRQRRLLVEWPHHEREQLFQQAPRYRIASWLCQRQSMGGGRGRTDQEGQSLLLRSITKDFVLSFRFAQPCMLPALLYQAAILRPALPTTECKICCLTETWLRTAIHLRLRSIRTSSTTTTTPRTTLRVHRTRTIPTPGSINGQATNFGHEWLILGRTDFNLGTNDHLFIHFKVDHGDPTNRDQLCQPDFRCREPAAFVRRSVERDAYLLAYAHQPVPLCCELLSGDLHEHQRDTIWLQQFPL